MSISFSPRDRTYDVFMNISGEEHRQAWIRHFLEELDRKSITTFRNIEMKIGGRTWPETVQAIKNSRIAVVVFSNNYASSRWCLNELVEIVSCNKIIIPIFYGLDLSDVKTQSGEFGEIFEETCKDDTVEAIDRWKKVLTYAANEPGYVADSPLFLSMKWNDEAKRIEAIADDIWHMLPLNSSKGIKRVLKKASSSVDPLENTNTTTSDGDEKDNTFGMRQRFKELGEKLGLKKIRSRRGMIIGYILVLFFSTQYFSYKITPLLGEAGGAINRIVMNLPKVLEYSPPEKTEIRVDRGSGAKPVRSSSSDAKTNADLLDRTVPNSQMYCKVKPPQIQVFINFRGDQVRKDFVGYLMDALRRREVNVFIDNHEPRGEDLNTLFKRIEDSGIAIVVFSTRYTESKWCLEELVKIKERVNQGLLKVLPIFYKVTPTNVKRLKGEFGDHFRDKEHMYGSDSPLIKRWKEAILFVSHKFAMTFDEKSRELEYEFVETIVKEVLKMLQVISTAESGKSSCNPLSCGVSQS